MLAVNSVLRYEPEGDVPLQRIVILHISDDGSTGWSLNLEDPKALPQPFVRADFERHLYSAACTFDPPNCHRASGMLTEKQKTVRDARWAALRDSLTNEPAVYEPERRAGIYREAAERSGLSLNTVRTLFQTYWRGGKTYSALVPLFTQRGAPGAFRQPGEVKLGRPRNPVRKETGINLNREQKRAVAVFARAQFRRARKHMLVTCYNTWLNNLFYCDSSELDDLGRRKRVPKPEYAETGVPTLEQFKRIYYSLSDVIETSRKKNPRAFALTTRPLTGTATAETWGPGSRFLIDATMADIYLRSRDGTDRIVGRPIIYIVIDVWSRLIVGLYVAIEDASWSSAMMALANAACSKVAYCAEHGLEIEEDDWPAANIGARLMSDHSEVDSKVAGNLAEHFNRIIEAPQAYRGDLKGLVETQFNTNQVKFGQFVPGYVEKDFTKRGARDYRLDALFDINSFTATMIDIVLERNSKTLEKYDRDQGMPADTVPLSPIELWHWGIRHRSGRFQAWPEEYVRFRLMPTAKASVDRNGISFQGRSYVGKHVLRMMSQARMGQTQQVVVSFDPRIADAVYLHTDEEPCGFEACGFHPNSRAYEGRTCVEADQDFQLLQSARRDRRGSDATRAINTAERMKKRVRDAKALRAPDREISKSEQTKGIRENRRSEKEVTKQLHGESFRPARPDRASSGIVVPIRQPTPDDYAESTLADFMNGDE
jgi:hypothetical protein